MTTHPTPLDRTFSAPIGVEVKGETWSCVEVPGSAELLGTGRSVRVDATVDDVELSDVGLMPTGAGGHMLSLSAKVRARLGKDVGDTVTVRLLRRTR
ncbi:DUF1905 domain-containing protein [Cellulosimicrobium terreum]|nr:DUF1905 domain-containing protein [Cellulosimicrobium terreum]